MAGPACAPPQAAAPAASERPARPERKDPTPAPPGQGAPSAVAEPPVAQAPPRVPPLFKRFPALREKLPYVALGSLPTSIDKAAALGNAIGVPELYIKRDDLSGEAYGGSKIRKLEFLLGDAKRAGKGTVVTFGGVGSNHAVATAMYAERLGMKTIVLLFPQPITPLVRHNLLAGLHFGADLRCCFTQEQAKNAAARLVRGSPPGQEPYVIDAGGSSPLGNIGLVDAAFELKEQIDKGQMPEPDFLYIALGTMGSAVGLSLGLKAAGLRTTLIPVRASTLETSSEQKMIAMFNATNDYLRSLDPSFPKLSLRRGETGVLGRHVGDGYAQPTAKGASAMGVFAKYTTVELEPVYTAKAFAALIDDAPRLLGKVVLFWNTFGSRKLDLGRTDPKELPAALHPYFKADGAR
jgi:1-aminocyclopropane-1-carboxylate deaminase/D-cysteine desulfhydrase-like pyridoxal-dependent ACC family enzyme